MVLRPLCLVLVLTACAQEPARSEASSPPVSAAVTPNEPAAPVVAKNPAPAANAPAANAPEPAAEANDPRWHPLLQEIAAHYTTWGRVDDQMRWAPTLCAMPQPARARISASGDESTHGRKLYTLYAKDPVAYGAPKSFMAGPEIPGLAGLTQVVVKEAFRPLEVAKDPGMGFGHEMLPAEKDGKRYMPGEPMGLYVVFKPAKPVAETDAGWVYGTIATDGKTVTSAGRVGSCMGCHVDAKHERLFGTDPIKVPPGPGPDGRHHVPSNR
jgi:hypothetical protein